MIMKITGHETMECFKRYDTITIDDLKMAVGAEISESWHKLAQIGQSKKTENELTY